MKYYINVTSWNLLESFVTESVSPYSFYEDRDFGNNLSRCIDAQNEKTNYLVLSAKDRGGDYIIIVDESLLDPSCMTPIKKSKTLFTYGKTIFYKKGAVSFRFSSENSLNALVAESQILFEVKCVEKYLSDFHVKMTKRGASAVKGDNPLSFQRNEYVWQDNCYDKVKGAIVGFVRGIASNTDEVTRLLITRLKGLKNSFTSLNTSIMVNGDAVADTDVFVRSIMECKNLFLTKTSTTTNLFDILAQQFHEVAKVALLRKEHADFGRSKKEREKLLKEKDLLEKRLSKVEAGLLDLRQQLDEIKTEEKRMGEIQGKVRVYFKKGSEEYERKKALKFEIKKLKSEHGILAQKIADVKRQLGDLTNSSIKYDAAISALFARISDIMNDLLRNIGLHSEREPSSELDFSIFGLDRLPNISLNVPKCSKAELDYFNAALAHILSTKRRDLSDAYILELMEASASAFKSSPSSNTEEGRTIVETLRTYWKYKHNRACAFDIPQNLPVFRSVMAFFIKPYGFDQMERYMQNRDIANKQYCFTLWGAAMGYAALPKTFTNLLYNNENTYREMDDYLLHVHSNLETACHI